MSNSLASLVESLESRRLLSAVVPTFSATAPSAESSSSTSTIAADVGPVATDVILTGRTINAIATQGFRAVIGTIRGLGPLPTAYTLHGQINWGDGTPASEAQFVRRSDGSIAVLGAHTYAAAGGDTIKVDVTEEPPPWSDAAVRLVGTFTSKANVIAANGGVTLEEIAGVSFTDRLGFFHTTANPATLSAVIDWGDGTQSPGKIEPLPTAGPVPTFAVSGTHAYATTGSYRAHVTVYSYTAPPSSTTTPPIFLVAQFDSVIDVLPPEPATAAT
jgi:hypothetical protein